MASIRADPPAQAGSPPVDTLAARNSQTHGVDLAASKSSRDIN
jgi:hypothetical protein